jgi:hypothetical protein
MARSHRSAITGRYISKGTAARSPRTTVSHRTGSSGAKGYRSAITGHFVSKATAARHPRTTITEG